MTRRLKPAVASTLFLFFLALCLPAGAAMIRGTATPDVDHLVMQRETSQTAAGSIIQYMLIGFQATDRGMEARIAWHVLKKKTTNLTFAFTEFTISTDTATYKSIGVPGSFTAENNEAGSFSVVFPAALPVTKLGIFTLTETVSPGASGLSITSCRVLRSNIND